ncbi:MAG: T9SS type A sorting domain-containing protein, partial [Flavobacteriales bacterium]
ADTSGVYAVIVGNQYGCWSDTSDTLFHKSTHIVNMNKNNEKIMHIYPIPSNGFIQIKTKGISSNYDIQIYDIKGRLVYHKKKRLAPSPTNFDLSSLKSGKYILQATGKSGLSKSAKKTKFTHKLIIK